MTTKISTACATIAAAGILFLFAVCGCSPPVEAAQPVGAKGIQFTPQASRPCATTNCVWMDTNGALRSGDGVVTGASGNFASTGHTNFTIPSTLADTVSIVENSVVSIDLRVTIRRADNLAGTVGNGGLIFFKSVWRNRSGTLAKISETQNQPPAMLDSDVAAVGIATSRVSGNVIEFDIQGVSGAHIDWLAQGFVATQLSPPPTLANIIVGPADQPVAVGGSTQQYTALGYNTDGTIADITATCSWTSSSSASATIDSNGLATTGSTIGTPTITCTKSAISGSTTLFATANYLVDLSLPVGQITDVTDDPYSNTGNLWLQQSISTISQVSPTSLISEHNGVNRGVWSFPTYENALVVDHPGWETDFTLWGHTAGTVISAQPSGTAPDGVGTAYKLQDNSSTVAGYIIGSTTGQNAYVTGSLWIADYLASPPNPQPGTIWGAGSVGPKAEYTLATTAWRKITAGTPNFGGTIQVYPASQLLYPFDTAAPVAGTGSVLAAFPQLTRVYPYPLSTDEELTTWFGPYTTGRVAARNPKIVANAGNFVTAGDLRVAVRMDVASSWGQQLLQQNDEYLYIWRAATSEGDAYVRLAKNGSVGQAIEFGVRGATVISRTYLNGDRTLNGGKYGQEWEVDAWYLPSVGGAGSAGLRLSVNGCYAADVLGTATGGALAEFTEFDIGHAAGLHHLAARYNRVLSKIGFPRTDVQAEIVTIGDSISGSYVSLPRICDFIYDTATNEWRSRAGIRNLAIASTTIAQAQAGWEGYGAASSARAVIMLVGANDFQNQAYNTDGSGILTQIQALIDSIHFNAPLAKVLVALPTPQKGAFDALPSPQNTDSYTRWLNVTAGIPNLTGIDYLITATNADLNDGTYGGTQDKLARQYSDVDVDGGTLHPGWYGRDHLGHVIYRNALRAIGLLN